VADLHTPHIPLGLAIEAAIAILQRFGAPTQRESDRERCYRADTPLFAFAVYPADGKVRSVWYDDPTGRESDSGRMEKAQAYLQRYGRLENWELRLDNGWMHYWFNPTDHAQMVYGIHKDVIRFNQYSEQNA
jgi:hypothetical protein